MLHTIQQFFDACQPFGYPLLLCSVTLLTAIFYHIFMTGRRRHAEQVSEWITLRQAQNTTAAQALLQNSHNPLMQEVDYLCQHKEVENIQTVMESRLRVLIDNQRSGLAIISVITNIAPMLGILGTAWGLVDIFGFFGTVGAQEGIAMGISKALYTTIFGLAIALPGMIALTCAERALERRAALTDRVFTQLLSMRHQL